MRRAVAFTCTPPDCLRRARAARPCCRCPPACVCAVGTHIGAERRVLSSGGRNTCTPPPTHAHTHMHTLTAWPSALARRCSREAHARLHAVSLGHCTLPPVLVPCPHTRHGTRCSSATRTAPDARLCNGGTVVSNPAFHQGAPPLCLLLLATARARACPSWLAWTATHSDAQHCAWQAVCH